MTLQVGKLDDARGGGQTQPYWSWLELFKKPEYVHSPDATGQWRFVY